MWLLHGDPQGTDISERVVIYRLLRAVASAHWWQVGMTNPSSLTEVLEAVKLSEAIQAREAGERSGPYPCRAPAERHSTESNLRPADLPAPQRNQDEPMPTDPNPPETRARMAAALCTSEFPPGAPEREVRINGQRLKPTLDTAGSSISLIQPDLLKTKKPGRAILPFTCVPGDTRYVPVHTVTISAAPGSWTMQVGVLKDLPVPLLLVRD